MRIRRIIVALGIAVALAAVGITVPVTAQEQDRETPNNMLIPGNQADCAFTLRSFSGGAFIPDPDLFITVANGSATRVVILQLSAEAAVNTSGTRLNLRFSVDGGPASVFGPEFFSGDTIFSTRTAIVLPVTGGGLHSYRPFWQQSGGGTGSVFFRCFTGEARTR
jgi:hypothetical protein